MLVYYVICLHSSATILDNWNEKWCCESNILTMEHEVVFETSNLAAVNALPNTIIYLKTIKYLNITLRQIYLPNLELKIKVRKTEDQILCYGCKDSGLQCWKLKILM